jgi:hypothetical protein
VINKAVALVKAIGKLLRFGKEEKKDGDGYPPEIQTKIDAGFADLEGELGKESAGGAVDLTAAEQTAAQVKGRHPVFHYLRPVVVGDEIDFDYEASSRKRKQTKIHARSSKEAVIAFMQSLVDKAVAEIRANPKIAKDLMSAESYRHFKNKSSPVHAASIGKAVERLVLQRRFVGRVE